MREYNFEIEVPLRNGLAPDARAATGPYCSDLTNLVPSEHGAFTPDWIRYPISSPALAIDWPFPQLFRGERVLLLCDKTAIYAVTESTWATTAQTTYDAGTPANVKAISAGGPWHVATFQDLWVASNGTSLVWKLPSNSSNKVLTATTPTVQAIGQHGNRLFFGGLAGAWFSGSRWLSLFAAWRKTLPMHRFAHEDLALDTGWVFWSERGGGADDVPFYSAFCALGFLGNAAFDAQESYLLQAFETGEMGIVPVRTPGAVRAIRPIRTPGTGRAISIRPISDDLVVYGSNGISLLSPSENSYEEQVVARVGVPGRGAAGGSDLLHAFVDNENYLWPMAAGGNLGKPRYANHLAAMTGSDIVISYDPLYNEFWIADGALSYVMSETGLGGPMTAIPTSLIRSGSTSLVGPADGLDAEEVAVQAISGDFDINERGSKHCTEVTVNCTGINSLKASVLWKKDGAFVQGPWKPVNKDGVAFPGTSFVDGRVAVKGTIPAGGDRGGIDRIVFRYNAEDLRYRRGTTGVPETVQ